MTTELFLRSDAHNTDLYDVLGLPHPSNTKPISSAEIKAAHRRAILKHHPDKAVQAALYTEKSNALSGHSIDTIQLARSVLLSPSLRAEYDRNFLTIQHGLASKDASALDLSTAVETIDLDDMDYDEKRGSWTWPCRCGNSPAYEVSKEALSDMKVDHYGRGEVIVACEGCSLYKRVAFEVTEEG